jgi:hypothetical protein
LKNWSYSTSSLSENHTMAKKQLVTQDRLKQIHLPSSYINPHI